MKRKNFKGNIKSYLLLGFITIMFLSFSSCEFKKKNGLEHSLNNVSEKENVAINVKEAKLFFQIAKLNLNILKVNDQALKSNMDLSFRILASNLEKSHKKIELLLDESANRKLILLPKRINNIKIKITSEGDVKFKNPYLKDVYWLINQQLKELISLKELTSDVELEIMVVKIIPLLKSNLNQIEKLR
ncbi:hypothetical protein [Algibacter sp.]|uniref:hypothetical protein n=1 Tax=Algibacter sp. TaxID=1872428 RepID=UPI003C72630C